MLTGSTKQPLTPTSACTSSPTDHQLAWSCILAASTMSDATLQGPSSCALVMALYFSRCRTILPCRLALSCCRRDRGVSCASRPPMIAYSGLAPVIGLACFGLAITLARDLSNKWTIKSLTNHESVATLPNDLLAAPSPVCEPSSTSSIELFVSGRNQPVRGATAEQSSTSKLI